MRRAARATMPALLAVAIVATVAGCGSRGDPEAFGRDLVMSASMPKEDVERFNAFVPAPQAPKPGTSILEAAAASKTESWRAPSRVRVSANANPYLVAIRVTGKVTGDEGAVTLWFVGFERYSRDGHPSSLLSPVAGLNAPKGGAKGDGRFARVGKSGPVSFREDGEVAPVVEIQRRTGLVIEGVDVEVWSGLPNPTWREMLLGWRGAVGGLVMLVLWWFWFRVRK